LAVIEIIRIFAEKYRDMKRVVGYVRVSTVAQDVERQKKLIRDYVSSNGYILVRKIEVDKVSGAKADRAGLNTILSLTNDDADMVVVSELSRLSREDDIMNVMQEIHRILNNGLDLILLDEPDKVYSANQHLNLIDFIALAIKAYGAAEERKKITQRMKTGIYSKLSDTHNMRYSSTVPFGFKAIPNPDYIGKPDTAKSLIVEGDSNIVKMMYQMVLDGKTIRNITDELERLGIKGNKGKPINYSTVRRILRNPLYNGRRIFNNNYYEINKIIDDDMWNMVQAKIDSNKLFKTKRTEHFNPLKGILKCPCGHNMMLEWNGGRPFYTCAAQYIRKDSTCADKGASYYVIIKAVWNIVLSTFRSIDYKDKNNIQISNIKAINAGLQETIDGNKESIKKAYKDINTIIDNIATSTNSTVINKLNERVSKLEDEIKFLEKSIKNAENSIRINEVKIEDMKKEFFNDEIDERQQSEIFKSRLEKIVYYSENSRNGFIVVTFKNGTEYCAAYHYGTKPEIYTFPNNFRFNSETRKMLVPTYKKSSETTFTVLSEPSNTEYGVVEIIKNFGLPEFKISE